MGIGIKFESIDLPEIPEKSAVVGLKALVMPMAGSTDLRLNLFCILNLSTPNGRS